MVEAKTKGKRGMYGDLVTAIAALVFIPFYWYLWLFESEERFAAALITSIATGSSTISWISWSNSSPEASLVALVGHAVLVICQFSYEWPLFGQPVALPSLLWMLLRASVNFPLAFSYKLICGLITLATTLVVSAGSPLEELSRALPLYLGITAIYVAFHYCAQQERSDKQQAFYARTASILLAGTLAYHYSFELSRMYSHPEKALESCYSMTQASFFAAFGFITAGAFSQQVDISEALELEVKKRTKEIVKQARELQLVGLALQVTDTAIAIVDQEQRIEWSNPALSQLLKVSSCGQSLLDALALSQPSRDALNLAFDPNTETETEVVVNDSFYRVAIGPVPAGDEDPKESSPVGSDLDPMSSTLYARYIVALKDITAQRQQEDSDRKAQREELLKKAMLNSMETLSHEIRSPLQGILGMTSLLADAENLSIEEAKEGLSMVMVCSRMLLMLINNLLDVRKIDERLLEGFELSSVPLAKSLQEAADFCRPIAAVTNVELSYSQAGVTAEDKHDVMVLSNPIRFQQVLINLVSNAIKYTRQESDVKICASVLTMREVNRLMSKALECGLPLIDQSTEEKDDKCDQNKHVAVVSVIDSGEGVPSSAANIFGRFSQSTAARSINVIGQNTVAQPTGTGLGLNLCVKFVERMHGNIWVSNAPNGGACFSFYLPLATNKDISEVSPTDRVPARSLAPARPCSSSSKGTVGRFDGEDGATKELSKYKVLVVDDLVINLKVIERMLVRIGLKNVNTMDSGEKALAFLEKEYVDLVLTDIQMPNMSGHELSESIHQSTQLVCSPMVVAMTAETSENLYERCRSSGISYVLHKPITTVEMQRFFSDTLIKLAREGN